MIKSIDLQWFADLGTAVKGARLFIAETYEGLNTGAVVNGVRTTGDKGADTSTVDATTITDTTEKQVLGTQGASDLSYTFALTDDRVTKHADFANKTVYILEEMTNTEAAAATQGDTPVPTGSCILYQGTLTPLVIGGAESNNLREFTQKAFLAGNDFYYGTYAVADCSGFVSLAGVTPATDEFLVEV